MSACLAGEFSADTAREEWREKVSKALKFYDSGYELSAVGEIVHLAPRVTASLLIAKVPVATAKTDREKVGYSDTQQDDYNDTYLTWLFFVFLATHRLAGLSRANAAELGELRVM